MTQALFWAIFNHLPLNLNSIAAHNFIKVALLKAYLSVREMDILCLSETYLDSSVPLDDDNLQIPGYSSVRTDHPSNTKRGEVLIQKFYSRKIV